MYCIEQIFVIQITVKIFMYTEQKNSLSLLILSIDIFFNSVYSVIVSDDVKHLTSLIISFLKN